MIRRSALICAIALLALGGNPAPGAEREAESARADGRSKREASTQEDERAEWRERLLAANQEFVAAQKRSETALRAYQSMRHRRRPRGEAKQAILDELELSRQQLASAQQNLEDLEKAARRAGAPPSWLKFDPAEIGAATQVPASQQR